MKKNQGLLQENHRILSATAGVGGNFGAFSYVCGPEKTKLKTPTSTFAGKKVLILGASGNVGLNVAEKLSNTGAELYLQGNINISKLSKIKNAKVFSCDFTDDKSVAEFVLQLKNSGQIFDYVIKLSGSANPDVCMKVNFLSPAAIINSILPQVKSNIVVLASASEDIEFPDAEAWIASIRAFHGYLASASGEFLKNGIRTVYLLSGFLENGISAQFNEKYIFKFILLVGQESRLKTNNISNNIIKSLYLPKVLRVAYSYENAMLCGRVGYQLEVDV
jgi:short-subunit dehydrogenase